MFIRYPMLQLSLNSHVSESGSAPKLVRAELETRRIVYGDRRHPHARHQELKVDVRRGEVIDDDYAAAMVAARTTTPLADVFIVKVTS